MIRMEMTGVEEVLKQLGELPRNVQLYALKQSIEQRIKAIGGKARSNAPIQTGALVSAIQDTVKVEKERIVGRVEINKGWFQGDTFYGAFQEFGWRAGKRKLVIDTQRVGRNRRRRRINTNRRPIEGKHYMANAWASEGKDRAAQIIIADLADTIEQYK